MATILDKDLLRETRISVENKELLITLTEDQRVNLKLKGVKGEGVSIGIAELYSHLVGDTKDNAKPSEVKVSRKIKGVNGDPSISLYELRSHNLVTKMDMKVKLELEGIICDMIKQNIKLFENEK
jgi:hypothetical protein